MIFVNRRNRNNIRPNYLKDINLMPVIEEKKLTTSNVKVITEEEKIKEMLWGEPTWFLFHTLAEKIKPQYFNTLRNKLFGFIKSICNNLPCPDCAKHATQYMNKINFDAIVNKEQLKLLLFKFHNEINSKKKYKLFEFTNLDSKYSSAITINIVRNFFVHFSKKNFSVRLDTSNYQRTLLLKEFRFWLEKNHYCFEE